MVVIVDFMVFVTVDVTVLVILEVTVVVSVLFIVHPGNNNNRKRIAHSNRMPPFARIDTNPLFRSIISSVSGESRLAPGSIRVLYSH